MILASYWWLIIPGLLLGLYAQTRLSSVYRRFVRVPADSGLTGAQAARAILDDAGLRAMEIHEVPGHLTDHYHPTKRALFLSSENYHGRSLAAVGVAAHEAGHALQHQAAYTFFRFRMALVPATQIATSAYLPILLIGFFVAPLFNTMLSIAIGVFAVITLFQVITLPVEFDASRRAKEQLVRMGLISGPEKTGVATVLNAAALTYVAAMVSSMLTLLQLILLRRE